MIILLFVSTFLPFTIVSLSPLLSYFLFPVTLHPYVTSRAPKVKRRSVLQWPVSWGCQLRIFELFWCMPASLRIDLGFYFWHLLLLFFGFYFILFFGLFLLSFLPFVVVLFVLFLFFFCLSVLFLVLIIRKQLNFFFIFLWFSLGF